MSNNRNNNRRRGRGGNRQQGGNQMNRIDNRARGNAPQLLDKYKKLAHDASLNGDRVQAEYYLQFADHYFRVVADGKARQEEARAKRDAEREARQNDDDGDNEDNEQANEDRKPRRGRRRRDEDDDSGEARGQDDNEFEPADNPFVKEKKPARPRSRKKADAPSEKEGDNAVGLDPSALPPAIGAEDGDDGEAMKEAS